MEHPWPTVQPNDPGIRPAGPQDACFYCRQKVGQEHGRDCPIVQKRVKVRYSFEIELLQPHHWDKGRIEFHRNDGSWCAVNAIRELEGLTSEGQCLCPVFNCEVLDMGDGVPVVEERKGE